MVAGLLLTACPTESVDTVSPKGAVLEEREAYLNDRSFRRETLEASLTSRANHYARRRLDNYALESGGWDTLPEWTPKVAPMRPGNEAPLEALWAGDPPTSDAQWRELGRRVFFYFPLRAEAPAEWIAARPELAREVGLQADASGEIRGLVRFADFEGSTRVGITCALCHSRLEEGEWVVGRARRELDYGALRLAWYEGTKRPLDPELARRMSTWGKGRADITDDSEIDPVAIPDLWRVGQLEHLTQAATLRQVNTSVLAIRQETQILFANGQRIRPPRELMWALAVYVQELEPPAAPPVDPASQVRGAQVFETHCASCHQDPLGSGPPLAAAVVGSDPSLAQGPARGTGQYRPAPLIDLERAAPYLHDGSVRTLEDLLDPERLTPGFVGGALGPGPVRGHEFGLTLDSPDRGDLLTYLRGR